MSPTSFEEYSERLPFPIAYHVRRCGAREAASSVEAGAQRLSAALEAVIRYLALVLVSDYLQQGAFDAGLNGQLGTRIRRSLPLGLWMEVLRDTAAAFFRHARKTRPPELVPLLFVRRSERPKPSEFLNRLDELISSRNGLAHKSWRNPADALGRDTEAFREVLRGLAFLADYPLVVPMRTDPGDPRTITAVVDCMRPPPFSYRECRIDFPEELGPVTAANTSPVLLDRGGDRVLLNLYPLTVFELGASELSDELYRYERSEWDGDSPHRLTFAPNRLGCQELDIRAHGERAWILQDFRSRFIPVVPVQPAPAAAPGRDFALPSMEAEIDARKASFVGRAADCDRLTQQLDRQGHGYVCYRAPFGVGKSAFAAFLIRHFGWPGCLIKRESGRDQPARFLRHLLARLMEANDRTDGLPDGVEALEELLFGVLEQAAGRSNGGWVVIVLDGLDSLAADARLSFLSDFLPKGVFFVLFSQPCALLDGLRGRVQAPWTELPLGGLSDDDALEFLDAAKLGLDEGELQRIIAAAKGFPYFLERAAQCVRAARPWAEADDDLEAVYRGVLGRAFGTPDPGLAEHVLGLLCTAAAPIPFQKLTQWTAAAPHHIRAVLAEVEPHLLPAGRTLTIFHDSFRTTLERELRPEVLNRCREQMRQDGQTVP